MDLVATKSHLVARCALHEEFGSRHPDVLIVCPVNDAAHVSIYARWPVSLHRDAVLNSALLDRGLQSLWRGACSVGGTGITVDLGDIHDVDRHSVAVDLPEGIDRLVQLLRRERLCFLHTYDTPTSANRYIVQDVTDLLTWRKY